MNKFAVYIVEDRTGKHLTSGTVNERLQFEDMSGLFGIVSSYKAFETKEEADSFFKRCKSFIKFSKK